jgi:hypothetical protein
MRSIKIIKIDKINVSYNEAGGRGRWGVWGERELITRN